MKVIAFCFVCVIDYIIICMLQVSKLKEQLETTVQKLNESREVLKTNENGEDTCLTHVL